MSEDLLEVAAVEFGDLLGQVIFLGGATIGLWITDSAARAPRVTDDVDVIVEVTTLGAYEAFQEALRARGFREDQASGVICRWRAGERGLTFDVIPAEPRLAGFGGAWLARAAAAGVRRTLASGIEIRAVPPAYLVATKLEAFWDRGDGDPLASKDFEDITLLIDGRDELLGEIEDAEHDLRDFVSTGVASLAHLPLFEYGLEGALLGVDAAARAAVVTIPRFAAIAALAHHPS